LVTCLSDGLAAHEWRWLNDRWNLAFSFQPARILGPTLIWSDHALDNQLDDFIGTRNWPIHRVLHHLLSRGAPIQAVANVRDLKTVRGPILVINPHLFSIQEQSAVAVYEFGPVLTIGPTAPHLPTPDHQLQESGGSYAMKLGIYRHPTELQPLEGQLADQAAPIDSLQIEEPFSWVDELYFRPIMPEFLNRCVQAIQSCSHSIRLLSHENEIRLLAMESEDGRVRLLLRNDSDIYLTPEIDAVRPLAGALVLSGFVNTPLEPRGPRFRIKIPLKGTAIVDLTFTGGGERLH
jgi:hypothetical protein